MGARGDHRRRHCCGLSACCWWISVGKTPSIHLHLIDSAPTLFDSSVCDASWYHHWAAKGAAKAAAEYRWVKPSFVGGGAVSLSIYFKICTSHFQILTQFPILFDIVFPKHFQGE